MPSVETIRKTCCWLALLLTVAALINLKIQSSFDRDHPPVLPAGMKQPGVALQLAQSAADVQDLAYNADNRLTFRRLQSFDEITIIPAYVLFFAAISLYAFRLSAHWTRWFGIAIGLSAVAAAFFDYREDFAIISVLDKLDELKIVHDADALAISSVSFLKWGLLFAMLLFHLPLFLRHWSSLTLRVSGFAFAVYAAVNSMSGLPACFTRWAPGVESAANTLAAPTVFFLVFVAFFHKSGIDGLNYLAQLPILRLLVSWPDLKEPADRETA